MRRSAAARLVLAALAAVSTGFATCGDEARDDVRAEEEEDSPAAATVEEEQEDMYRDIDR